MHPVWVWICKMSCSRHTWKTVLSFLLHPWYILILLYDLICFKFIHTITVLATAVFIMYIDVLPHVPHVLIYYLIKCNAIQVYFFSLSYFILFFLFSFSFSSFLLSCQDNLFLSPSRIEVYALLLIIHKYALFFVVVLHANVITWYLKKKNCECKNNAGEREARRKHENMMHNSFCRCFGSILIKNIYI